MEDKVFKDTPIIPGVFRASELPGVPSKIQQMRQMYEYGGVGNSLQAKNFYRQGKFMEDFEDNATVSVHFQHYFPTYHDMNVSQLRTYFTWRTNIRKNGFTPNSLSYVYLYIYELLNGIGVKSPEESLTKIDEIRTAYSGESYDARRLVNYLNLWSFDFCIVNNLPHETLQKFSKGSAENDHALSVLRNPDQPTDDEIVAALELISGKKITKSPVFIKQGETGKKFFAGVWRFLSNELFTTIFGDAKTQNWEPFANAVYYPASKTEDAIYELYPTLSYLFRHGAWYIKFYEVAYPQKRALANFVGAVDFKLRKYFHTGSKIKESEAYQPFFEGIDQAIRYCEFQSRPQVSVNLSSLDQIRTDSAETRESLLTEEDLIDIATTTPIVAVETVCTPSLQPSSTTEQTVCTPSLQSSQKLQSIENQILIALLQNSPISEIIKTNHLMPTVLADKINEIYFDEFADNVVDCDGSTITLIDDYVEDLKNLLL